jgi:hypothetical protein
VKLEDFKALNPSANRPVILAAGTPQILLPWDNATVFKRNFEAYTHGQYASWTAWTAPADHERRRGRAPGGHERGRLSQRQQHPAAHADPRRLGGAGAAHGQEPRTTWPRMWPTTAS